MFDHEFDFRLHLFDTIILLGGRKEIADLIVKSMDGFINEADIDDLRNYNASLIDQTKAKLTNINRLKIQTESDQ